MNVFEDLPGNIQALLRIKLLAELNSEKCENIFALAKKWNEDVERVWRDICRKAGQPVSSVPVEIGRDPKKVTGQDNAMA